MELIAHDRRELAEVFREAYASASGDFPNPKLLSFFVAYRAMVRGKVNGVRATEAEIAAPDRTRALSRAQTHWLVAQGMLEAPGSRPCLVLVGGLPGSGKTTLARELSARACFRIIRSDQVRKELAGVADADTRSHGFEEGIYSPEWTERTYEVCLAQAESELFQGRRVVVDATLRGEARRKSFLDLAARMGVPGILLICQARPAVIRSRLESRRHDLSDADWSIHQRAALGWEPPCPASAQKLYLIDTTRESGQPSAAALELLRCLDLID
jgi:predicted kinase